MRTTGLWLIVAVLASGAVAGCATPPAICSGLDNGQDTLVAARNAYGDAEGDPATAARMLREGAGTVRTSCAEHARAADQMDAYAKLVSRQAPR